MSMSNGKLLTSVQRPQSGKTEKFVTFFFEEADIRPGILGLYEGGPLMVVFR